MKASATFALVVLVLLLLSVGHILACERAEAETRSGVLGGGFPSPKGFDIMRVAIPRRLD